MTNFTYSDELYHHGIKGQRWGVRRFQNEDGTLTEAGKARQAKLYKQIDKKYERATKRARRIVESDPSTLGIDNSKPLSQKDFKKVMKASQKNLIAEFKIEREEKLRDLRKKEVDEGMNYLENRLDRNTLIGSIIAGPYGSIGAGFIDQCLYPEQYAERNSIRSDYKKKKKATKQIIKSAKLV